MSFKPDWIPVEVRLPSDRRRVLVSVVSWTLASRTVHISRLSRGTRWEIEHTALFALRQVTHWAELPEAPAPDRAKGEML